VTPSLCLAVALVVSAQLAPADVTTADAMVTGTVAESVPLKKGPKLAFKLASIDPAPASFDLALPTDKPSAELLTTSSDLLRSEDSVRSQELSRSQDLSGSEHLPRPEDLPYSENFDQMTGVQKQDVSATEMFDECFVVDVCVDRYLWALYQRAPKLDTITVQERRKVTIKRKGKKITVTRNFGRLVDEDFTWKDPHAADKVNLAMMDYVIGGMDRGFKLKLYHLLHAAEAAGLSPGITSAFRDDYRQEIASGLKAASNRSYHGGSLRGGYGHGMAADVVSTDGATRAARWITTQVLWKWIDAHGEEFGVARPYHDRDPPHLAPLDGEEYAKHNPGKVKLAKSGG
jgi:hypothetical protein